MDSNESGVGGLQPPHKYQATREAVFPSPTSLQWFIRRHRARLIEADALLQVSRRNLIHPDKFDAEVLAIGQQQMREAA